MANTTIQPITHLQPPSAQGAGRRRARYRRQDDLLRPHRRVLRLQAGHARVPQPTLRDRDARRGRPPGRGRGQLHRARGPLYPHHRAQALRVRHAGQDRHHARVPGGLEARRRALLPHQRRQERGPLQAVRGAGGQEGDVIFAGRLGGYKYYDMDKAIAAARELLRNELGVEPTEA